MLSLFTYLKFLSFQLFPPAHFTFSRKMKQNAREALQKVKPYADLGQCELCVCYVVWSGPYSLSLFFTDGRKRIYF